MKKELNKKYNHHQVESDRYDWWVNNGFFKANVNSKKPAFSIIVPPPNVTGKLHLGHAWGTSLQDAIIRYKKLQGFETLFLPGMDHAGIATQTKVEAKLKAKGISRFDLGREKFLEETWKWKDEYAQAIREQWKKLGLALDYSKEKFTLDKDVNELINYVFVDLYNKGLIYKGKQIVNWDPVQKTAISNIEVIYKEVKGKMYYFKYFLEDKKSYLTIATTRPETMFADQVVVVNSKDKRYQKYLNKMVINPVNQELLPVIADDYVEMDFGTGVMKATPAHDANDFEIGKRHHLAMPLCLNEDGTVNELGGEKYQGLDRFEARKKIVETLKREKTLVKVEDIVHQVGFSERSDAIVEPYLSTQWFVKMEPLAKKVLALQNSKKAVDFFPPRFNDVLEGWMENIHDWTISRQLWWGHQIPAWYHKDTKEIYVNVKPPKDLENWVQDNDVLDTWFSSGLWPLATLNWTADQKDNKLFDKFFPSSVLVTGYDIIFFWVARMIFSSLELVGEKPFDDVLIHGLIRDEQGRKMSKSLGNGVDPMEVIDQYGADSLRFFLLTNSTPGQDVKYSDTRIRDGWNFINKLWNASRFVFMNLDNDFKPWKNYSEKISDKINDLSDINKWILTELSQVKKNVSDLLEKYEFGIAGRELYNFVWSKYCSWFIELSKVELTSKHEEVQELSRQTLFYVLKEILILLHPLIPFATEEIYQFLNLKESILEESIEKNNFKFETTYLEFAMEIIKEIREFRTKNNVKKEIKLDLNIANLNSKLLNIFGGSETKINMLLKAFVNSKIVSLNAESLKNNSSIAIQNFFVEIDNVSFFNKNQELKELASKLESLEEEIKRSKAILANKNFLAKAAKEKILSEKEKFENYQEQYQVILKKIADLKN